MKNGTNVSKHTKPKTNKRNVKPV